MSLVIASTPTKTAGAQQFAQLPIIFSGYQVKDSIISNKVYWDNSSAYPVTNVTTGTTQTLETNFFRNGDLYNTVYNPGDTSANVPLVGQKRSYTRITSGAIDDGAKIAVNFDLSNENWAVLVVKSTDTSVAGKLKIRSSAGNETVCTFTTSATANTQEKFIFNFKDTSESNVSETGTTDFTGITELEITLDSASESLDVGMVYFVNNYTQIIGEKVSFTHQCVSEASFENTLDISDLLCGQQVEESIGSGRSIQLTVGARKKDIEAQALAIGDVIKIKRGYYIETLNDDNVGAKEITAGTITVPAGLTIGEIYIQGVGSLKEYNTATNIPEGAYHYDSTTITFNTAYNGKIPKILIWNLTAKKVQAIRNLELGYVGILQMPRKIPNSNQYEYITAFKAQIMLETEGFNDDFDQVNFMYKFYPVNGLYAEKANDL